MLISLSDYQFCHGGPPEQDAGADRPGQEQYTHARRRGVRGSRPHWSCCGVRPHVIASSARRNADTMLYREDAGAACVVTLVWIGGTIQSSAQNVDSKTRTAGMVPRHVCRQKTESESGKPHAGQQRLFAFATHDEISRPHDLRLQCLQQGGGS